MPSTILRRSTEGEKVALGEKVVVVGGGSVAMDAARTAKRLGAPEVHVVCLECRELGSKDSMLALENEILEAEEEGVIIHPSLGVQAIVAKDGKVAGVDTVSCLSVREPDGSFNPQYDATCTALSLDARASSSPSVRQPNPPSRRRQAWADVSRRRYGLRSVHGHPGRRIRPGGGAGIESPSVATREVVRGKPTRRGARADVLHRLLLDDDAPGSGPIHVLPSERIGESTGKTCRA